MKPGDEVVVSGIFSSAHEAADTSQIAFGYEWDDISVYLSIGEARIIEPGDPVPTPGALTQLGPPPARSVPIGMKFALIPAGEFLMGSDKNKAYSDNPTHLVRITRPFYLGIHEVTQGEYQAVMGEKPSYYTGSDDLPVERVSWLDAVKFCNKLSERNRWNPTIASMGASGHHRWRQRLPTAHRGRG